MGKLRDWVCVPPRSIDFDLFQRALSGRNAEEANAWPIC